MVEMDSSGKRVHMLRLTAMHNACESGNNSETFAGLTSTLTASHQQQVMSTTYSATMLVLMAKGSACHSAAARAAMLQVQVCVMA